MITLTYYGAEKVVAHYNVMGVAKAALEASVRYLAADLGPDGIRVNAISAGPIRTLAAGGIAGFRKLYGPFDEVAPLRAHITIEDVGKTALYLGSDLSSAVTGEVIYVDGGFSIMGVPSRRRLTTARVIPRSTRPFDASVLGAADGWDAPVVALAVVDGDGLVASRGPLDAALPWASVTKLLTAAAVLAGVARGALALDDPAGPPGATVRHLLAHAAGPRVRRARGPGGAGRTRIYSNTGSTTLRQVPRRRAPARRSRTLRPRVGARAAGDDGARLAGAAVRGARGARARTSRRSRGSCSRRGSCRPAARRRGDRVAFPGLRGVLPGFGLQDPHDWGLGFEIRGHEVAALDGARNSPRTFGHFGGAGRSCGSTRRRAWRCVRSRTGRSAPGRARRGRRSPTRCWPAGATSPRSPARP